MSDALFAVPGESPDAPRGRRLAITQEVRAALRLALADLYPLWPVQVSVGSHLRYIAVRWTDGPSVPRVRAALRAMGALPVDPDACIARGEIAVRLRRECGFDVLESSAAALRAEGDTQALLQHVGVLSKLDYLARPREEHLARVRVHTRAQYTDAPVPSSRRRVDQMALPAGEAALAEELRANGIA